MKLKHSLPKHALEAVEFVPEGAGEAGWMVYLREGYSFDPSGSDSSRFVPLSDPSEVDGFTVFTAAESASAAGSI